MKPITPLLKIGDHGPEVANLQKWLLLLMVNGLLRLPAGALHQLINEQQASVWQ